MYTAFSEDNRLISSDWTKRVICSERDARYEEMRRVNHCKTDSFEVGEVGLGPEGFLGDPVTGVVKETELFKRRIGMVSTVLVWTKDGLRKAQKHYEEIAPLLRWKETMPDGPEKKNVLMFGMATHSYVQ